MKLRKYPNFEDLTKDSVEAFIRLSNEAIRQKGRFALALSGGSTPAPFYRALAESANRKRLAGITWNN